MPSLSSWLVRSTDRLDAYATPLTVSALGIAVGSTWVPIDLAIPVAVLAAAYAIAAALVQIRIWQRHGTKTARVRNLGGLPAYWDHQLRFRGVDWPTLVLTGASLLVAAALGLTASTLPAGAVLALGSAMLAAMISGLRRTWSEQRRA